MRRKNCEERFGFLTRSILSPGCHLSQPSPLLSRPCSAVTPPLAIKPGSPHTSRSGKSFRPNLHQVRGAKCTPCQGEYALGFPSKIGSLFDELRLENTISTVIIHSVKGGVRGVQLSIEGKRPAPSGKIRCQKQCWHTILPPSSALSVKQNVSTVHWLPHMTSYPSVNEIYDTEGCL